MKSPLILASGIMGVSISSMKKAVEGGAAAVTSKSISREERQGHSNPTMLSFGDVFMNAVGYSNPGAEAAVQEFSDLSGMGVPVIGSVIGTSPEDFAEVLETLKGVRFKAVEVPLSCPHTPGFGMLAGQGTPEATTEITKAVRKSTGLPVIIKLSPVLQNLCEVAKAAEKAGADAVNMGNTHGPGMRIDVATGKPVLDFKVGGVSGSAIRPISVRCVYDLYKSLKIPIIGTGGVTAGSDAIEMIMAGASAVGIGTGVYYRGFDVFNKVASEMELIMEEYGYSSLKDIRGAAHNE